MLVNFVSVICMVLALSMIVLGIFKFVSGFISGRDHSSVGSGAVMLVAGMLIMGGIGFIKNMAAQNNNSILNSPNTVISVKDIKNTPTSTPAPTPTPVPVGDMWNKAFHEEWEFYYLKPNGDKQKISPQYYNYSSYNVVFDENTLDKVYTFTFVSPFTGTYNFYSRGEIDLKATLYSGDTLIGQSDDISDSDRNFCVTAELTAGTAYTYKVSTMHEQGSAKVVVYPDVIESFDIDGSLTFNASDGYRSSETACFPVVDSALGDFVLDIHFSGGYSDKIYYAAGYFDNKQIKIADTQSQQTFTCGENTESLAIGSVTSDFTVFVNHEYKSTVVPYTAYDDGYTLHTCILCGDSYKSDFVPSPAVTVSGRCMLATNPDGSYSGDYPLDNVTITFHGKTYHTDENGYFYFRTFFIGEVVVSSPYCDSVELMVNEGEDAQFGVIPLPAYDFNRDGYVNGRDLAKFKTELQNDLGKDYFKYAINFM